MVAMLIRSDIGIASFILQFVLHSMIYCLLFVLQFCAHAVKDNIDKIKKMREINAGYQGFQLTETSRHNYLSETMPLKDESNSL